MCSIIGLTDGSRVLNSLEAVVGDIDEMNNDRSEDGMDEGSLNGTIDGADDGL